MIPVELKSQALNPPKADLYVAHTSDCVSLFQQQYLYQFEGKIAKWQGYLYDFIWNVILLGTCNINYLILPFRTQINFQKMCDFSQDIKTKANNCDNVPERVLLTHLFFVQRQ